MEARYYVARVVLTSEHPHEEALVVCPKLLSKSILVFEFK